MRSIGHWIVFAIALQVQQASAFCEVYPAVAEELNESDIVIVASVTKEELVPDNEPTFFVGTLYYLKVEKTFKGPKIARLRLFSENTTSRFPMDVGRSYLVFARRETELFKDSDTYWINSCGNSKPATDASHDLELLKEAK